MNERREHPALVWLGVPTNDLGDIGSLFLRHSFTPEKAPRPRRSCEPPRWASYAMREGRCARVLALVEPEKSRERSDSHCRSHPPKESEHYHRYERTELAHNASVSLERLLCGSMLRDVTKPAYWRVLNVWETSTVE